MEFRFRSLARRFEAFRFKAAIIRTLSDGRDVTQLGPEVFSGASISQGAQYLGMDTVNSPSQVGHELMCWTVGRKGWQKQWSQGPPNAGGGVVVTGWPGEISSSE
jgi:hypothetical protein